VRRRGGSAIAEDEEDVRERNENQDKKTVMGWEILPPIVNEERGAAGEKEGKEELKTF
jgi:hypothetical protein